MKSDFSFHEGRRAAVAVTLWRLLLLEILPQERGTLSCPADVLASHRTPSTVLVKAELVPEFPFSNIMSSFKSWLCCKRNCCNDHLTNDKKWANRSFTVMNAEYDGSAGCCIRYQTMSLMVGILLNCLWAWRMRSSMTFFWGWFRRLSCNCWYHYVNRYGTKDIKSLT